MTAVNMSSSDNTSVRHSLRSREHPSLPGPASPPNDRRPLTSGGPARHPNVVNGEADALVASLNDVREHVLGVVEELPENALRAAALPSGWTPLGLVQHLAGECRAKVLARAPLRGAICGQRQAQALRPDREQHLLALAVQAAFRPQ